MVVQRVAGQAAGGWLWGLRYGGGMGVTLDNLQGRACPAQDVVAISQEAKFQEDG